MASWPFREPIRVTLRSTGDISAFSIAILLKVKRPCGGASMMSPPKRKTEKALGEAFVLLGITRIFE